MDTIRTHAPATAAAPWCADCGDGTYRNPVLFADYSDPDAIRVGEDYWLTASSFGHVPGLPILHSRDLVNWSLVNHALPQLVPTEHFKVPRHGQGVWAPAIRHHRGKFWIFYPDPDFGIYVVTADDPRGAWSAPQRVLAGKGLIDPCPFWEENGQGYLVHGWARSRSGINNRITLHRLASDNSSVVDPGVVVVEGGQFPGWHTIEGPKLYRRGDYYYIFAPAGGVADGYQAVFRARKIEGPYEPRIVLERGRTAVNGPHQGAWVDTPAGEHWFIHFQELPAHGRVVHLQPMRWRDDGWPVMGCDFDADGRGEPVLVHPKPTLPRAPIALPPTSDDFRGGVGLQWQWQANAQPHWASVAAQGGLRLACVPRPERESLWTAGHLLMQKFAAPVFMATTLLRLRAKADGDAAGLIVFGYDYAWLGLRRDGGQMRLVLRECRAANGNGVEKEIAGQPCRDEAVRLRVSVTADAQCQFSWSREDAREFTPIGMPFRAKSSMWVGAKVGLFASAAASSSEDGDAGCADVTWFEVAAIPNG